MCWALDYIVKQYLSRGEQDIIKVTEQGGERKLDNAV